MSLYVSPMYTDLFIKDGYEDFVKDAICEFGLKDVIPIYKLEVLCGDSIKYDEHKFNSCFNKIAPHCTKGEIVFISENFGVVDLIKYSFGDGYVYQSKSDITFSKPVKIEG